MVKRFNAVAHWAIFYFLSKATSVYADVVYDSQSGRFAYGTTGWQATNTSTNGTGYTVGLRHLF